MTGLEDGIKQHHRRENLEPGERCRVTGLAPDDDHLLEAQLLLLPRTPVVQHGEGEYKCGAAQHCQHQQHAEQPYCLPKVCVLRSEHSFH